MRPLIPIILFCIIMTTVVAFSPTNLQQKEFVNDLANIIDPATEARITAQLITLEQSTTIEFAVVTVPSLENEDIFTASLAAAEYLGVGKKDVDNGLLLFVAPNERQYQIQVGQGLEGAIPDVVAGRVGSDILVPAFKEDRYGAGIEEAITVLAGFASQDPTTLSQYQSYYQRERGTNWFNIIFFIIFIILAITGKGGFFPFFFFMGGNRGFNHGNFGSGGFGGFGGGGFGGGGSGGGW